MKVCFVDLRYDVAFRGEKRAQIWVTMETAYFSLENIISPIQTHGKIISKRYLKN